MATMDLLFTVFLVCLLLWFLRHMNAKYETRLFIQRISALRLKLVSMVEEEAIDDDEMYQYFDGSFRRMMAHPELINLYVMTYLLFKHRRDDKLTKDAQILRKYCEEHPALQSLYGEYMDAVLKYLKGQHMFAKLFIWSFLKLIRATSFLVSKVKVSVKALLVLPETSQSSEIDLRALSKKQGHYAL